MRYTRRFILGLLLVFVLLIYAGSQFYLDILWFQHLDYENIFWNILFSKGALGLISFLLFFLFLYINLKIATRKISTEPKAASPFLEWFSNTKIGKILTLRNLVLVGSVFAALLLTSNMSSHWLEVQSFLEQTAFGINDPLFHKDVAFYVFSLPFYRLLYGFLMSLVLITLVLIAAIYLTHSPSLKVIRPLHGGILPVLPPQGNTHVALLAAAAFLLKAWDYRLNLYDLVYSARGAVFGAGYTDVHATMPMLYALMGISIFIAVALLVNIYLRRRNFLLYGFSLLVIASLALGTFYPALVQRFRVEPNEFVFEKPYIEYNIAYTQKAFGLEDIERKNYPATQNLVWDDLEEASGTLDNVRIWDYRPLNTTYNQLQAIRPYYQFTDIDTDRYQIDGNYRQVMFATRELNKENLDEQAKTWVNLRLQYTHGYGLAMSPVNEAGSEGLPTYMVGDIPVRSTSLDIKRPEVYYGELSNDFVIVNSNTKEFDYPSGDTNVFTEYKGTGGIPLGSLGKRLLFALKFSDYRILISGELNNTSRVMFDRDIATRIEKIAPFLHYDADPYIIVGDDGKLYWIRDAYTATTRYPYAQAFDGVNYMRNPVKVVVDAYNGDVNFYLSDPNEPIIKTYSKIFPGVFQPLKNMPAGLEKHLHYPENLFMLQAQAYKIYHMTNPNIFYNREDLWQIPSEKFGEKKQQMEPYYTVLELPGTNIEEFVLIIPYTPVVRDNMIAWLAARCDAENYGELLVFNFPKDRVIFGPSQIENRIDQDTEISEQLSLWDQHGSQVIRGNLIVLPIKESILYVEPIYLQAEDGGLPELVRVIAAFGNKIVMEPTFEEALIKIFGEQPGAEEEPEEPGEEAPPGPTEDISVLTQRARQAFDAAQEQLRKGNWAAYGEQLNELAEILEQLEAAAR